MTKAKHVEELVTEEDHEAQTRRELDCMPFRAMLYDHIKSLIGDTPRTEEGMRIAAKRKFTDILAEKIYKLELCDKPGCNCIKEREAALCQEVQMICEFADKEPAAAFSLALLSECKMHITYAVESLTESLKGMQDRMLESAREFMEGNKRYMLPNGRYKWGCKSIGSSPSLTKELLSAVCIPESEFSIEFKSLRDLRRLTERQQSREAVGDMLRKMFGK